MELTLIPQAGLCNRINAIISAFAFCNKYPDIPIKIYWEKSKDCYADFDDLFLPVDTNNIKLLPLKQFILRPAKKTNLYIPRLMRKFMYDAEYDGGKISNLECESWMSGKEKVYITSYNRFCLLAYKNKIGDLFKPTGDIENKINEVTYQYASNTIGIHIRRTDNLLSIKNSPIELFYKYMDGALIEDDSTKFYVASDDEKVKEDLKLRYGNNVITHNWVLERFSVQGMKDAVAELFCLARTNKIIGSANSTYSRMAANLYGIPTINKNKIEETTDFSI